MLFVLILRNLKFGAVNWTGKTRDVNNILFVKQIEKEQQKKPGREGMITQTWVLCE